MSRRHHPLPQLRPHGNGQYFVRVSDQNLYFGVDAGEAERKFDAFLMEYLAAGRQLPPAYRSDPSDRCGIRRIIWRTCLPM